tara:strand:- start:3312 stop:3521 length:210 start_codon:yes stop_codon:yes gene_type:complete
MKEENRRITKQELQKIYNVDRTTIEVWVKNYDLPMIVISSHSKYIRENDLINWENSMIMNNKLLDILEV